jgi:hypothetical protein
MSDARARIADAMTDNATPPKLGKLPLQTWGYYNCPAIPFWADANGNPDPTHVADTVKQLTERGGEADPAYAGLSTPYTIGGNANITAYEFLYGSKPGQPPNPASPLCHLPLDEAGQFTLPWTNYDNVYTESLDLRDAFADTLKNSHKDIATHSFWPTIAYFGIPYNLLLLSKINAKRAGELKAEFGNTWTSEGMDAKVAAGLAYEIDTRIIEEVESYTPEGGAVRFVPGCITLLAQDAQTKALAPTAVKLFTTGASDETRVYAKGGDAWIYALQAAKTSITVWGIWLGHVFHWHIPTTAMQMTMYNALPDGHPLWKLLAPQSDWLIDFDYVLLQVPGVFDQISPPTPVAGPMPLLALLDKYAAGRDFFDLDPLRELKKQGLDGKDFRVKADWDAYPVAGYLINIWKICEGFVKVVVDQLYKSDPAVAKDPGLKAWIDASKDPKNGNVKLPDITTRALLVELLTSLLYRVTAHGAGSLTSVVNPTLAFMSNFPPCLQSKDMPQPNVELSDSDLLKRMPYTGTMGTMATFYFTFAYSEPYVPAIPKSGDNLDPYWPEPGTPTDQACNAALLQYRKNIRSFVTHYTKKWNDELARIRGVPAGPVPSYAENQAEQWPRSIEI